MSNYSAEVFFHVHRISDLPNARAMLIGLLRGAQKNPNFTVTPIAYGVTQKAADRMIGDALLVRVTDANDPRPSRYDDEFRLTRTGYKHAQRLARTCKV